MLLSEDQKNKLGLLRESPVRFLKEFQRDEEGGIIIMTLLLLVVMLVMGGMAVDFMRFESRRAMLQSVADRSVLAAAELDQTLAPDAVVVDFFESQGYPDSIIGTPDVDPGSNSRSVSVRAQVDVNTFFLRLIGIDTLTAPARASATEGTGNVEVSLVLDISGSMGNWVSSESTTKMELLRAAAKDFVDDLLLEDYEDRISINLVAYSQHVGIGDGLYDALNTTPDTISPLGGIADTDVVDDPSVGTVESFTNPARCVDFLPEEYSELELDTERTYQQVEYFDHYSGSTSGVAFPVCPEESFEQIILLSQNATTLKDAIDDYRPTSFTSIHLGMKWGVSLLDPSMRDLIGGIAGIDPAFAGERPSDYTDANTVKYLVLMTDGQNVRGRRIEDAHYRTGDANFSAYEWQKIWSQHTLDDWLDNEDTNDYTKGSLTDYPTTADLHDTWMQSLCDEAIEEYVVFTIAMGAGTHGTQEMAECVQGATNGSRAYSTTLSGSDSESGIDDIFDAIAAQITALRLKS